MNPHNTKAFMAHLPLNYEPDDGELTEGNMFDYLEQVIQEYGVVSYLIGYEDEPYEHFHFVIEFEKEPNKQYHNLCKRVFKDKFKLRGQAKKGKPRQYGCLSKINNIEKMCAYTLKDQNFRTNMTKEIIDKFIEISRDNVKSLDYRQKILKHLEELKFKNHYSPYEKIYNHHHSDLGDKTLEQVIKKEIIKYATADKDKYFKLSRAIIENLYIEYLQKYKHLEKEDKDNLLYEKFFSHH